jgi:hypothetical protein
VKATFDALDEDGSGELELGEVCRGTLEPCRAPMRSRAKSRMYACALDMTFPDHRTAMLRSRGWPRRWGSDSRASSAKRARVAMGG